MSGLEMLALIPAIVSAFVSAGSFLRNRRIQKDAARRAERQKSERSLQLGQSSVNSQYYGGIARLGNRFVVGDDISRGQLTNVLITLQQKMIESLLVVINSSQQLVPQVDYQALKILSDVSRLNALSILSDQYQRHATALPLAPLPIPVPNGIGYVTQPLSTATRQIPSLPCPQYHCLAPPSRTTRQNHRPPPRKAVPKVNLQPGPIPKDKRRQTQIPSSSSSRTPPQPLPRDARKRPTASAEAASKGKQVPRPLPMARYSELPVTVSTPPKGSHPVPPTAKRPANHPKASKPSFAAPGTDERQTPQTAYRKNKRASKVNNSRQE
ncbi:MAG: hypothetical protein MMC23_005879 [Stictis urceolatum]|nr:hypothetical protein [Stictis urceolata]